MVKHIKSVVIARVRTKLPPTWTETEEKWTILHIAERNYIEKSLNILAIHIKSININTGNLNVKQRRDDIE